MNREAVVINVKNTCVKLSLEMEQVGMCALEM